ncbi:MAG: hypothetical protein OEM28_12015 [Nitrosopumilus sp.]|nr:hypothetical protein [Nitrosopumilus sp.]MDH3565663.1 hypothetical protein [Nitrosopumilus sp.]
MAFAENGVSYSPLRESQTPLGPFPTNQEIVQDMISIRESGIGIIRIFETGGMLEIILQEAEKNKINVAIGINIISDNSKNLENIQDIISRSQKYSNVDSYIIGNNSLWDKTITLTQLLEYLQYAHSITGKKITTINGFEIWNDKQYFGLADYVDYILVDMFTTYDTKSPVEAVKIIKTQHDKLQEIYNPPIIIETGWSTINSTKLAQDTFRYELTKTKINHFLFEWADESYKSNPIESGFGIYDSNRVEKPAEIIIPEMAAPAAVASGVVASLSLAIIYKLGLIGSHGWV